MAASPSLRRFHGGESRVDSHKRGRSLESGLNNLGKKDDDLALFSEMHRREQENFLLQSSDDFEDVFSTKLKTFPDYKLGITIPVRGETSDLLNADSSKTDYDWLLTPPETPLFRSLDDEPAPINLVHSGRPQSRPISISRSYPMEKSHRNSRASASPQRLSPSSGSGSSTVQGRPSSAPHLSPTLTLRHSTSLRRPSPPPSKPSMTPPRSGTPPPSRSSIGSGDAGISIAVRGTSPVRTGRGYSASPKVRAWQSNIPGFSLEAPPNLRTSLADRPASYVRGSSPARRNSKDSSSKFGRQSISPSATRSISSSRTNERDRISSYSRVSSASSVDDDSDSLQSVPLSSLERSVPRRVINGFPNNHPSGFAKKPTKTISPNSAPKRSFDSAMRQMDRKNPQNMFRPLLSGVPSTTFYGGKASSSHRVMVSINPSITTSSNASSDLATSGAPDTEGSDQYHDDMASECGKGAFLGTQDGVFGFDKEDGASEFTQLETQNGLHSVKDHNDRHFQSYLGDFEEMSRENEVVVNALTSKYLPNDSMEVCGPGNLLICSRCGCSYLPTETIQNDFIICLECQMKEEILTVPALMTRINVPQNFSDPLMRMSDEPGQKEEVDLPIAVAQWPETGETVKSRRFLLAASHEESMNINQISGAEPGICCSEDPPPASVAQESLQMRPEQIVKGQYRNASGLSDIVFQGGELQKTADGSRAKFNLAEGTGVSLLLLKKSSSGKGPVLQSRNITSSAMSYDDSSYARDSSTSIRSSIGYGSASTSSSLDLTVSKHAESFMQRQLSSTRSEMSSKPQSSESTYSVTSAHVSQALGVPTSTYIENYEVTAGHAKQISDHSPGLVPELLSASEKAELPDLEIFLARRALSDAVNFSCHTSHREKDADTIEMSSYNVSTQSEGNSLASFPTDEDHGLHENDKQFADSIDGVACIKDQGVILETSVEESTMQDDGTDPLRITEIVDDTSLAVVSEIDVDDCQYRSPTSQTDVAVGDDFHASAIIYDQDKEIKDSVPFSGDSDLLLEIVEDSTVIQDVQGAKGTRSLTLEEATDTILFCSSIIHGLAYEAATLAIEKEKENLGPPEGSVQTVNLSGNLSSGHREPHGITPRKRPVKSLTPKSRQVEKETEPTPWNKTGAYEKPAESTTRIVGLQNKVDNKVDSMKPPIVESKCSCTIM